MLPHPTSQQRFPDELHPSRPHLAGKGRRKLRHLAVLAGASLMPYRHTTLRTSIALFTDARTRQLIFPIYLPHNLDLPYETCAGERLVRSVRMQRQCASSSLHRTYNKMRITVFRLCDFVFAIKHCRSAAWHRLPDAVETRRSLRTTPVACCLS